jgi:hypothetical protein
MLSRLTAVLAHGGANSAIPGLTFSSPTEYLGMMGLSEAVLYTLRLYALVIEQAPAIESASEETVAEHNHARYVEYIEEIKRTLSEGYSGDKLMRRLLVWLGFASVSRRHCIAFNY